MVCYSLIYILEFHKLYKRGEVSSIMETIKCPKCEKVIEGFTLRHVNSMLEQHMIKHKNEKKFGKKKK